MKTSDSVTYKKFNVELATLQQVNIIMNYK